MHGHSWQSIAQQGAVVIGGYQRAVGRDQVAKVAL